MGTEHYFKQIRGVTATEVGYANGNLAKPSYEQVSTGNTGFVEAVKVDYDPTLVDLKLLIDLYFKTIDPTSMDKQGNDIGTQYRTGIYFTKKEDEKAIRDEIGQLAKSYSSKLVVEIGPLRNFYTAENYHQNYLEKILRVTAIFLLTYLRKRDRQIRNRLSTIKWTKKH
ncbi:peptide-methionine (S)-S-oxide reductase MsrA [Sphingobacterium sp. E70]|uniref:peptide-methionine (S)-S-oxide reductase MsrA n=1 Tax=Sphingobacterium sp. E70 TaxID=2853439 RepID=UPI00211B8642|nr:peptide-methionine (S)-S-oxide reductase MsrA [Sphingobacterium sp. E70]ULT26969.1 peptide-methionine (S)-S-oxide reductase MsrA [Sphingobacterium sp. E70]